MLRNFHRKKFEEISKNNFEEILKNILIIVEKKFWEN